MSYNAIDTDAALAVILSNFDSDYINSIVSDSLARKFIPFSAPMPNLVDILARQFDAILVQSPDYRDEVLACRRQTYFEILQLICNHYNLKMSFEVDQIEDVEFYGIVRTMYETFVSSFTTYMIDFFTSYVVQNADSIVAYLSQDPNAKKPKEGTIDSSQFIDPKYILIHANMNQIIINMASYDIPMAQLFGYLFTPTVASRLTNLFVDTGDIYKNHFASYVLDPATEAGVLTNVKLNLQSITLQAKKNIV